MRSPRERLAGYVILPRLIDKVRLHARGILPESYHPNLLANTDRTFDGRFLLFTGLDPEDLRRVILLSGRNRVAESLCHFSRKLSRSLSFLGF